MKVEEHEIHTMATSQTVDGRRRGAATMPMRARDAGGSPLALAGQWRAGKDGLAQETERIDNQGPSNSVLGAPPNYHENLLKNKGHGRNAITSIMTAPTQEL